MERQITEKPGLVTVTRGVTATARNSAQAWLPELSSENQTLRPPLTPLQHCTSHRPSGKLNTSCPGSRHTHRYSHWSFWAPVRKLPVSNSTRVWHCQANRSGVAFTPTKRPVPAPGSAPLSLKSWPPEQSIVVGRSPRTFPAVHWHRSSYVTLHTCRHRFTLPSGKAATVPACN